MVSHLGCSICGVLWFTVPTTIGGVTRCLACGLLEIQSTHEDMYGQDEISIAAISHRTSALRELLKRRGSTLSSTTPTPGQVIGYTRNPPIFLKDPA